MGNEQSLPRWARVEIENLRAELKTARAAFQQTLGGAETRIELDPYRAVKGDPVRVFLPEGDTIRYHLTNGYVDVKIEDNGDGLSIRAQDHLAIFPNSSNDVEVGNVKFEP